MKISIIVSILVGVLITDMMISTFFDYIAAYFTSEFGILIFICTGVIIFVLGLHLLSKDVNHTSSNIRAKNQFFRIIHNVVGTIQYIILVILIFVTIQMILMSKFSAIMIIVAIVISYVPASITFGYISYKFLLWFKSNKKDVPIIVYAIAFIMVCTAISINTVVYSAIMLYEKPAVVSPQLPVQFMEISLTSSGIIGVLYIAGFVPFIVGFIAAWAGTALLLGKRSLEIGRPKFLILVSLPLVSYLVAILPTLLAVQDLRFIFDDPDLIYFRILFKSAVVVGGILFGMVFLTISKSISRISREDNQILEISSYARIAGYGVAMLTILLASQVYHLTYPPFGVASSSLVALACYLVGLGFYASAISISENTKLRQIIRRNTVEISRLFDSIGTAQMEQEIQKRVLKIAKDHRSMLEEQTGISPSYNEEKIELLS